MFGFLSAPVVRPRLTTRRVSIGGETAPQPPPQSASTAEWIGAIASVVMATTILLSNRKKIVTGED